MKTFSTPTERDSGAAREREAAALDERKRLERESRDHEIRERELREREIAASRERAISESEVRTTTREPRMVTGVFRDRDSAERAYESVAERGYDRNDVNVVMSDETRERYFMASEPVRTELGNKAAEGAGVGGAVGATLGAIAAAVAAVGTSIAIPGLGLVIAGPVAAALAGAGAGGVAGGLFGALVGWGMTEERVKQYKGAVREGGIVLGVRPRSDEDARHFEQRWKEHRGEHIHTS